MFFRRPIKIVEISTSNVEILMSKYSYVFNAFSMSTEIVCWVSFIQTSVHCSIRIAISAPTIAFQDCIKVKLTSSGAVLCIAVENDLVRQLLYSEV